MMLTFLKTNILEQRQCLYCLLWALTVNYLVVFVKFDYFTSKDLVVENQQYFRQGFESPQLTCLQN